MKRIGMLATVIVLAAAGCGSKEPAAKPPAKTNGATTAAAASGSPSGTPSASAGALIEFSVDGAGPYQFDMTLQALRTKPGLDNLQSDPKCPQNTIAQGTGTWKDVHMSFHSDGKLFLLVNKSASIPTPSGAWLGTTLAQLKTIYAGVTGEDLTRSTGAAFLVSTLSGRGVLFELDPGQRVISMTAGDTNYLRTTYKGGGNFC